MINVSDEGNVTCYPMTRDDWKSVKANATANSNITNGIMEALWKAGNCKFSDDKGNHLEVR